MDGGERLSSLELFEAIQFFITSTLTLVSTSWRIEVILECQEQGTDIASAALPKRNILIVESYVTIAFVEDVVSFKRNRETILAESLVKLGIEARGRTELHVLLVSTAVPFKLFIKVNDL